MAKPVKELFYKDLRDAFFEELFKLALKDEKIVLLMADQWALSFEKFQKYIPNRLINAGIAEQNMISTAAGLALGGYKVFVHAISNFATLRCYEQIKVDLSIMNLPVVIVGVGAGFAYGSDGPTHHANQDLAVMRAIPGMRILNAADVVSLSSFPRIIYDNPQLTYVRFDKGTFPILYSNKEDFERGLGVVSDGSNFCIISTGSMVHTALKVKEQLKKKFNLNPAVIDVYKLKPLNYKLLAKKLSNFRKIVTIEEHLSYGGLGTIISDFIADNNLNISFRRFGLSDDNSFIYGDREYMWKKMKLDTGTLSRTIQSFFK